MCATYIYVQRFLDKVDLAVLLSVVGTRIDKALSLTKSLLLTKSLSLTKSRWNLLQKSLFHLNVSL